ncbi:M13-type metalloendopeptidase [Butyrivibrio sp. VCD2006]|uniref:M13-type metalloendopeptidase n=1 Tax=Butyrivibrio sp. VCD2006 TaxID=1280664 RepID=UPI00041469B3|nr:M13-type metalloendopeptidase [Butyrivibrio sp. VCD2006]
MKKQFKVALTKAITLLFCAFLLTASTGCASKEAGETEPATSTAVNSDSDKTTEKIWDFDAFVNDEWRETAEKKATELGCDDYSEHFASNKLIDERLVDIFENTDISSLPEDSDLYKALCVYDQLIDENWQSTGAEDAVKEKLAIFENKNTMDDLYSVFKDPYLGAFNYGMEKEVVYDEGCGVSNIYPMTISIDKEMSPEQLSALKDILLFFDYDEARADEIVNNSIEMNGIIADYIDSLSEDASTKYFYEEDLESQNVSFPIFDILRSDDAIGTRPYFISYESYPEFLNAFYTSENALKIKDLQIATAAVFFSKFVKEDNDATYNLFYAPNSTDSFEHTLLWSVIGASEDIITKEYNSRYVSDKTVDVAKAMLEEVRVKMRDIISDSDWLSVHGKELAKRKVLRQNYYYAENAYNDDFSDVTLTDNPLDNYIALRNSRNAFLNKQLHNKNDELSLYGFTMLQTNSYYLGTRNSIVIQSGELDDGDEASGSGQSFEEALGTIGFSTAHEISHGYDPNGSKYDFEGYYEPWMTDEEFKAYCEKTDKIKDFFDGMVIGEGCTLDGELVCNEAFTDLMAIECCLRVLDSRENADYDAFFRAYARNNAYYYTPEGLKDAVKDTHLPGKERVNYILGQFDKFYETYDIDPESPYYVPENKRLSAF